MMAGGVNAQHVACLICLMDQGVQVRADRIQEGQENDAYQCENGHTFMIDWSGGPPEAPQWPPPAELSALAPE